MPKKIIEKEDWIVKGFKTFAKNGYDGIVVEKISKELACSKSSFYWHFKTKEEYLLAIINYWRESDTIRIIQQVNNKTKGFEQFVEFISLVFCKDEYLDFIFYLKRYAKGNKKIECILEKVEEVQLKYLIGLIINLGYLKEEAYIKAKVFYSYLIGYHERYRIRKQPDEYMKEVMQEIKHFIKLEL